VKAGEPAGFTSVKLQPRYTDQRSAGKPALVRKGDNGKGDDGNQADLVANERLDKCGHGYSPL